MPSLNLARFRKSRALPGRSLIASFISSPHLCRFPGQEHVAGNTKIPSIIYYDTHGKVVAAGAEADTATIISQAEDEGWSKVEL